MVGGERAPLHTHFWQNNSTYKKAKIGKNNGTAVFYVVELVGTHTSTAAES